MISINQYIKTATPTGTKGKHSVLFTCPRCRGHRKLEYHKQRGVYFCHKCGEGGSLLKRIHPRTFQEELENNPQDSWLEHLSLYQLLNPSDLGWKYLQETRRLSSPLIHELRPHTGPVASYCYFPLYQLGQSQPCYFVGRSFLRHSQRKYLNPALGVFPVTKSEILWGLHRIRPRPNEVVLCEGIFDAIWERNRVALLGKTLSSSQLAILRTLRPKKVSVMLDGSATKEAARIAETLGSQGSWMVDRFDLPTKEDPDSMQDVSLERFRRRYI